jgi:hypothetical protein
MNTIDLEQIKNNKINEIQVGNPSNNPSSPSHQLSIFLQSVIRFLNNNNSKLSIVLHGSELEISYLSNALYYRRLLNKKIAAGLTNRDEIKYLVDESNKYKELFFNETGIALPF